MKAIKLMVIGMSLSAFGFIVGSAFVDMRKNSDRAAQFAAQAEANETFDRGVIFGVQAYCESNDVRITISNLFAIVNRAEELSRKDPSDAMRRQAPVQTVHPQPAMPVGFHLIHCTGDGDFYVYEFPHRNGWHSALIGDPPYSLESAVSNAWRQYNYDAAHGLIQ